MRWRSPRSSSRPASEASPLVGDSSDTAQQPPRDQPTRSRAMLLGRAAAGVRTGADRHGRRRGSPSALVRTRRCPSSGAHRREGTSDFRCSAGTRTTPRSRSGSRGSTGAKLLEVTIPPGTSHRPGVVHRQRFGGDEAQRQVDGVALRGQVVPLHHRPAGVIVHVNVCACHTPDRANPGRHLAIPDPDTSAFRTLGADVPEARRGPGEHPGRAGRTSPGQSGRAVRKAEPAVSSLTPPDPEVRAERHDPRVGSRSDSIRHSSSCRCEPIFQVDK